MDNRIKGFLGNTVNRENRGQIFIISHDHGYYPLINRYREKYGIAAADLALKKSIQAVTKESMLKNRICEKDESKRQRLYWPEHEDEGRTNGAAGRGID